MSKNYPSSEEDLRELEELLPDLMSSHQSLIFTNRQKVQWRRVQETLKNIRWNGGPHTIFKYEEKEE